jgi:hypothetical protein
MTADAPIQNPPANWRAEAERKGKEAFEKEVAEPATPPEPLSWLWKSEGGKTK